MNFFFSNSSPAHESPPCHLCTTVMGRLLRTISEARSINSEPFEDLIVALEQALSLAQASRCTVASTVRCQFCPLAPDIIRIVERIQIRYDSMKARAFLWSIRRLNVENLASDCRRLKILLLSIMDVNEGRRTESSSSSFSAVMFDGAPDIRFRGGNIITNVAGSSNVVIFTQREVGIDFRSVLILLLVAFLFSRLL
ncbi:hypothetical protein F5887DRAFT_994675 [Amanita rubescens]|nr:hypothetical protein F5887DRAFT_994675 [Amanita rubescens]